ncbi:hypothetical protein AB0C11_12570 [Streptomyces sp. NPDC039016]|uniref:hypothetical protein n=1 Tax=unclassified Streptomyces TaxID=2593676 RepID=UPI000C2716DB|nr:hypothetical protein [Streptomyces sp. CB02959]PJN41424.1 hypothetical protein CG747_06425 [Streptomyces sp. CB02959]
MTGLFGLLLVGSGASPAMAWGYGDGPFEASGDTVNKFIATFRCEGRTRFCINGAVNSGNTRNAQNVRITGNPSSSGSPTSSSGSNNSGSTANGSTAGSSNQMQQHGAGGSLHL